MMTVTPYDQLTRFIVKSDVPPHNEYLIDLDQYGGVGWCQCDHYKFRLEPKLCTPEGRVAARKNPDDFRCRHIRACREQLGQELVDTLTKKNNQQEKLLKAQMKGKT